MRETSRKHPRSWHARPGPSRPFPVRHGPIVNADGPGETGVRLPRAVLRPSPILALFLGALSLALTVGPAAAQASDLGLWVDLAGGRMGGVQWSVKVARFVASADAGKSVSARPCLQVGTKRERSRWDYDGSRYQGCVDRSSRLAATEAPLIVTGAQATAGLRVSLTAVGILASPAARRVVVTYEDGRQATIHLQRPSPSMQRRAGLARFRYAAFAVPGTWSVQRVVTESASGRTLWDSVAAA